MTYTKSYTAWADFPITTTPATATKLQNIDDGIATVDTAVTTVSTSVTTLAGSVAAISGSTVSLSASTVALSASTVALSASTVALTAKTQALSSAIAAITSGSGSYAGPEVFAASYGVAATSAASSNATNLQAAIDANPGNRIILPAGTINYSTTLSLKGETILLGNGVNGAGTAAGVTILTYTGADNTHGVQMVANDLNGVWLEGIRFIDGRGTATSGDMIHLAGVKNGTIIRRCTMHSLSRYGCYIGGASNHTSEGPHISDCWVYGGPSAYAIKLEYIDNWFEISNVWCDTGAATTITSAIYLGTMVQSSVNGVVRNCKIEVNNGANLLEVDSACGAHVTVESLTMIGKTPLAGEGGDVVRVNGACSLTMSGISSMQTGGASVSDNLFNDVSTSVTIGAGKRGPIPFLIYHTLTGNGGIKLFGNIATAVKALSADTTLDLSHHTLMVTTGAAAKTLTLPAASVSRGVQYVAVKVDAGAGALILDGNASETINGATTLSLASQYDRAVIVCDGTSWYRTGA